MKISVFGTGYVGLVTGTCFAEMGNDVICVDTDKVKIDNLKKAVLPIYEPGLEDLVETNVKAGRLTFTTDSKHGIEKSDYLFIAVGTPPGQDGSADLKYVLQVATEIATHLSSYKTIINKSTVPVGTVEKVRQQINQILISRNLDISFDVVSNPEFLKEGTAIEDCLKPSRVVVGCDNAFSKEKMAELYEPFVRNGHPIYFMDSLSSEMTKYAANAMLATKISFMNELGRLCEKTGADIERVRQGIGSDPRIGFQFIYPGLGYGGSCFPKDVQALIKTGIQFDENLSILAAVENTNKIQREMFFRKILKYYNGDLSNRIFGIWGLAFKPGTDDIREAPSIDLIQRLIDSGAKVRAHDPVANEVSRSIYGDSRTVQFFENQYEALTGADAMILVTEWKPFREPNFEKIKENLLKPIIFDGRNIYDPRTLKEQNFDYICIGRPNLD